MAACAMARLGRMSSTMLCITSPVDIQFRTMPELRRRYLAWWLQQIPLTPRRGCTLIGYIGEHIAVTDFRTLP